MTADDPDTPAGETAPVADEAASTDSLGTSPTPGPSAPTRRRLLPIAAGAGATVAIIGGIVLSRSGGSGEAPVAATTPTLPSTRPVTSTAKAPPRPPIVTGITAKPGAFRIALGWTSAPGDAPIASFTVFRDGEKIASGGGSTRGYVDTTVTPDSRYRYAVALQDGAGNVGRSDLVATRTLRASPGAARLAGAFDARMLQTAVSHVTGMDRRDTAGWRLHPLCRGGACDTRLTDTHLPSLRITLTRHGARYAGSDTTLGPLECGKTPSTSTYSVDLRAVRARALHRAWRVTMLTGTITIDNAPQLGCVGSHLAYSVTARLIDG